MSNYTTWATCAAIHRDMARLAKCDEAMLYHHMWAEKYEQMLRDDVDYFAITREVSA